MSFATTPVCACFISVFFTLWVVHKVVNMPANRFEPSTIKNKIKREEIARKQKREKRQSKLQRRLANAKAESEDLITQL